MALVGAKYMPRGWDPAAAQNRRGGPALTRARSLVGLVVHATIVVAVVDADPGELECSS
jgi:hypothetical protein